MKLSLYQVLICAARSVSLAGRPVLLALFLFSLPAFAIVIPACYTTSTSNIATGQDCNVNDYVAGGTVFNTLSSEVNLSGVVYIVAGGERCSGELISPTQVLTAAHCFEGKDGVSAQVSFGTGPSNFTTLSGTSVIDLAYMNSSGDGSDLAIVDLSSAAPAGSTVYQLFDGTYIANSPIIVAGFGDTGNGDTGENDVDYMLRVGENAYSANGTRLGISSTMLVGAFNNGVAANDPLSGSPTYTDEVDSSFGDSGGPSFYDVNGTYELVGVHDLLTCFVVPNTSICANPPSVNPNPSTAICPDTGQATPCSYYGEMFVDTSVEANITWIDQNIAAAAPEPSSWTFCVAALAMVGLTRRRAWHRLRSMLFSA